MIETIRKITWTQRDGKRGYSYHVYYKPTRIGAKSRHRVYRLDQMLPTTVLDFLLNAASVTTRYTDTGKVEDFI